MAYGEGGCKNGHQKDMCLKEIGLHAQNMLIVLGSIVNIIGEDNLQSKACYKTWKQGI